MNIKKAISPLSSFFSQNKLIKWTGRETIFPFYHTISDDDLPYISNLYPLRSIKEFKHDLEYFCNHFTPINIEEVYRRIKSPVKDEKPAFHLSFDDGLKEVYEIIAPILEEKGIPATFFVNPDFIDNKNLFYRYKVGLILDCLKHEDNNGLDKKIKGFLEENSAWSGDLKKSLMQLNYHDQNLINEIALILEIDYKSWLSEHNPYMSSLQISDLQKRGFTIGSHSVDHPRFRNIDLQYQKKQVEDSFTYLKENFDIDDRLFSFPFGDDGVSEELFDWMYDEGKCELSFGVSGIKDDYCANHLHRIPMDECQVATDKYIKSEFLYFMFKSVFNKNQIKRN